MRFVDRYPIFVTPRLRACREFWRTHLGFEVLFEASWFVLLGAEGASLAFMSPDHPSTPPGAKAFAGAGLCFELQVEDARTAYIEFVERGGPVGLSLVDEPFGQRRFGFTDPSGLWVDVIEQIEPAAGFWEQYPAPAGR
jgi:catechol 2,3-dioxygenase-like lactoylglutathione lyase family enzyme